MRFSFFSGGGKAARAAAWVAVVLCLAGLDARAEDVKPASTADASAQSGTGVSKDSATDFLSSDRRVNFPDMPGSMGNFIRSRPAPMSVPPPVYAPITPLMKRRLDNQSNWGFVTADDVIQDYMSTGSTLPDYGPDGRDRNSMSAVERFYDRQVRSHIQTNSASRTFSFDVFGTSGNRDAFGTANLFNNPTMGTSAQPGDVRPEALSELLGLKNNPMSPDAIRERDAQQRQIEAFKQALNFQQPVVTPAVNPSSLPGGNNNYGVARSSSGMYVPAKTAFDPIAGTYNPSLAVAAPVAPVSPASPMAPGQALPSASQTPSRVAPPKPDFSLPQRRF